MNIKLNILSIIRWEQLTGISFNNFNQIDNEEVMKLIFCMVVVNNDLMLSYEDFTELLNNKKIAKDLINKYIQIFNQIDLFTQNSTSKQPEITEPVEQKETEISFIKDTVIQLIINSGLDVKYVMHEMNLIDLPLYGIAYGNKINNEYKEKMTADRLWTYLLSIPNLSNSKIDSPSKFLPFEWEVNEDEINQKKEVESIKMNMDEILAQGQEIYNKINKTNK